jgi:hypothetical protein
MAQGIWDSALTGAATGAAAGSVVPGWGNAIGAGVGLLGGALGGYLSSRQDTETKMQKTKRHLIDQLLESIQGRGPYSDLFNFNEQQFQQNIAEPYRRQIQQQAFPRIQQAYIASGAQRSTGMEDALARAGIDIENQIASARQQGIESAANRRAGGISSILNQGNGAPARVSGLEGALQGAAGYLSSDQFGDAVAGISSKPFFSPSRDNKPERQEPEAKGFES